MMYGGLPQEICVTHSLSAHGPCTPRWQALSESYDDVEQVGPYALAVSR